jgi:prevent-host-death family protein
VAKYQAKREKATGRWVNTKATREHTAVISAGAVEFRQGVSRYLSQVEFAGERVAITRHGKPVAAVVPLEDLEVLEALDDGLDLERVKKALAEVRKKGSIPWEQVKKELGL